MQYICTLLMHSSYLQDETLSWLRFLFPWYSKLWNLAF
jgi:hypothetical protein